MAQLTLHVSDYAVQRFRFHRSVLQKDLVTKPRRSEDQKSPERVRVDDEDR